MYVVMQMCDGSLHGLLHGDAQAPLTAAQKQHLAQQAAKGVAHLHSHALVHRCSLSYLHVVGLTATLELRQGPQEPQLPLHLQQ